jgi:hypothetical protein
MKLFALGISCGLVMGLIAAIAYSGYQMLDDLERTSDLFWE